MPVDGSRYTEEDPGVDGRDREISLGPGVVLGVFLGLALVCAVFFGFGYSVGRRSVPQVSAALSESPRSGNVVKPSPEDLGIATRTAGSSPGPQAPTGSEETGQEEPQPASLQAPNNGHKLSAASRTSGETPAAASAVSSTAKAPSGVRSPVEFPIPAMGPPAVQSAGVMVQVAAFSHQQDAELVAGALTRRGYDVAVRQDPKDKLLHVQLGPFTTKKDADAMRQRLQADGYNAIVK